MIHFSSMKKRKIHLADKTFRIDALDLPETVDDSRFADRRRLLASLDHNSNPQIASLSIRAAESPI